MRIPNPAPIIVPLALAVGLTCASGVLTLGCGGDGPAKSPEVAALPEAQARRLAIAAAEIEGYDRESYSVTDANRQKDGSWSVFLQHAAPAPPGGHCLVVVDAKGNAIVHRGR